MSGLLNTESARAYVRSKMAGFGAVISRAEMREVDGLPCVNVAGAYLHCGEWFPFTWEVWIESGSIYGEW